MDRIKTKTEEDRGVKYYLNVNIGLIKPTNDITTQVGFSTNMNIALQGGEIDIEHAFNEIFVKLEDFCRDGSGWVFTGVIDINLNMVTYQPINGSSRSRKNESE